MADTGAEVRLCSGERPGRAGDTSCRGAEAAVTEAEVITEAAEAEVALEAAAPSMPGEAAPLTPPYPRQPLYEAGWRRRG